VKVKDDFKEELQDGLKRYYRHLAFIDGEDSKSETLELLDFYLSLNPKAKVAYAFHPWSSGAKDRMDDFRSEVKGLVDIDYSSSEKFLGETFDVVIMDLMDDFNPNYVSRLVDLARGGGLVLMYTRNLHRDKLFKNSLIKDGKVRDLFEERFLRKLGEHQAILKVSGGEGSFTPFSGDLGGPPNPRPPRNPGIDERLHELCMSEDQNRVLESFKFMKGKGKRVFILTAARGRGKSAVTGLALAYLLSTRLNERTNVIITSPSPSSSSQIMEFLVKGLQALGIKISIAKGRKEEIIKVTAEGVKVQWVPPDVAVREEGYMVVADEASALGVGYIDQLIRRWSKVVLVTTVHGYEGSGKAFLRYLRQLLKERKAIRVGMATMSQPLRYSKGDPIERWLYDTMLLDAEPPEVSEPRGLVHFEELDIEGLMSNDQRLRGVYGVLVTAHYRNNPEDLMIIADATHHRLYSLGFEGDPITVIQVAEEGGLRPELVQASLRGLTFEGDLIPDRMLKHSRIEDFGYMKGLRIVRIATLPSMQGRGFGSLAINELVKHAEGKDWIGASFVADDRVLNFWTSNGFLPVHVSPKRNEELGSYPIIVIRPLTERAKRATEAAVQALKDRIMRTLPDVYFDMEPATAASILRALRVGREVEVTQIHRAKLLSFLEGYSPYEAAADAIHAIFTRYLWDSKRDWSLSEVQESSLVAKVLQGRPWGKAALSVKMRRTDLEEVIFSAVKEMFHKYFGTDRLLSVRL
jgi:tRNA(Met) cytidine acetyltransferase